MKSPEYELDSFQRQEALTVSRQDEASGSSPKRVATDPLRSRVCEEERLAPTQPPDYAELNADRFRHRL